MRTTSAIATVAAGIVMLIGVGSAQAAPPQGDSVSFQQYGNSWCPGPIGASWLPRGSTWRKSSGETLTCVEDPTNSSNSVWVVTSLTLNYDPDALNITKADSGPNLPDLNRGSSLPEKFSHR
jgi:hypothetical protein